MATRQTKTTKKQGKAGAIEYAKIITKRAAEVPKSQLRRKGDIKRQAFARKMLRDKGYLIGSQKSIFEKYGEEATGFIAQKYLNLDEKPHIWGMSATKTRHLKNNKYGLMLVPVG